MEKYELILKVKETPYSKFQTKYRIVCKEERYESVKKDYLKTEERLKKEYADTLILINKLDENNEFLEIVQ